MKKSGFRLHKYFHFTIYQSFIILSDCNWSKYKAGLDVPDFHDTLEAFQDYNSSVINKEGLDLATAGCNVSIYSNILVVASPHAHDDV